MESEICKKEKCTGCYACVNACKHHCISMQEDEFGALHPVIDEVNCIHCNLCIKSCPNNVDIAFNRPMTCYAAWNDNNNQRKICASGGIGSIMAEYVLRHKGVLFGSRYNKQMIPIMTYTEDVEELEYFKGSRYVQSLVGKETFQKVKSFLKENRLVLFIGTPCQIAGLKTFLHKDYANLITVDLICHGVCPTKYLTEEVTFLSNKYNLKDVSDIRFRGNDGNNFRLTLWNKDRRKLFPRDNYRERLPGGNISDQYYILGFLWGVSLRENCYTCNYARPERVADITIGDFIGLGTFSPFPYKRDNVSSVFVNTVSGQKFYNSVSTWKESLRNVKREYEERLVYKPSLLEAFQRHPKYFPFVENYKRYGFAKGIRLTLKDDVRKQEVRNTIDLWRLIYKIPRKIYRKLSNIHGT